MTTIPAIGILPIDFLTILLLFSFISHSVCVEFAEDAGELDKSNAFRRQVPQWAVGHFMGKRSLSDDTEQATMYSSRFVESTS
uniref:Ranatensin n=1 Tax=Lithobates pipiens TaxID=8404 RepID=RANA_LITPI|nr:RecName: Full=Ranatensin; Flags: Precursor [Lithobates pipiens]AAA49533.1 ranatensin precursor [Lithobates pipiens]